MTKNSFLAEVTFKQPIWSSMELKNKGAFGLLGQWIKLDQVQWTLVNKSESTWEELLNLVLMKQLPWNSPLSDLK